MRLMLTIVAALALICTGALPVSAQSPSPAAMHSPATPMAQSPVPAGATLTLSADRTTIKAGLPILFTLKLTAPREFAPEKPEVTAKDLDILEELPPSTLEDQDVKTHIFTYKGTFFTPGEKRSVFWRVKGREKDGKEKTLTSSTVEISVESVVPSGGAPDIKDIKPPEEASLPWYWYAGGAGALLALAAITCLIIRRLRRKKAMETVRRELERPPLDVAKEKLDSLEKKSLPQAGEFKAFHSELSEIMREYFERRFDLPALERTTTEILWELRKSDFSTAHRGALRELLDYGDLVKFAKLTPEAERSLRDLASAGRLLDEVDGAYPRPQGGGAP